MPDDYTPIEVRLGDHLTLKFDNDNQVRAFVDRLVREATGMECVLVPEEYLHSVDAVAGLILHRDRLQDDRNVADLVAVRTETRRLLGGN